MRYYSDDKTVEKELNKTWMLVGLPFFTLMFGIFILGFYLLIKFDLNISLFAPLVIILGILLPAIICYQISKLWFSKAIEKVNNKTEFTERAVRNLMIFQSSADKILKEKGIILSDRKQLSENELKDLQIHRKIKLTKDYIDINGEITFWEEIKDFRIAADHRKDIFSGNKIFLILKCELVRQYRVRLKDVRKTEYEIDRYLNSKNK